MKTQVSRAEEANIELQPDPTPISADTLYWITLAEPMVHESGALKGQLYHRVLLHIEFQGKSTWRPMRLRELDYIVRVLNKEPTARIHSVVIYVGQGVGARDKGHYQVFGMGSRVTLEWRYDTVRFICGTGLPRRYWR
ncbi:MAG: hypothetical protein AAF639_31700 [Chloroflexota bacterium]